MSELRDLTWHNREGIMITVTLSDRQVEKYEIDDDSLYSELIALYGPIDTAGQIEVVHPDGFVVNRFEGRGPFGGFNPDKHF